MRTSLVGERSATTPAIDCMTQWCSELWIGSKNAAIVYRLKPINTADTAGGPLFLGSLTSNDF